MIFDVRVFFEDFNRQEGSTGIKLEGVNSLSGVDAFVLLYASTLEGLTDVQASKAEARTKFAPTLPQIARGQSSSYDRLILLCTNGLRYASITVPTVGGLTYETTGPFTGIRVDKNNPVNVSRIEAVISLLANTLTPTGEPFPVGDWIAARMVNPL